MARSLRAIVFASALGIGAGTAFGQGVYQVRPSEVDPSVREYDDPAVVIPRPGAPLAVFLPGTDGRPNPNLALIKVIASQGYAVISLQYPNTPRVIDYCPADPDPNCSAAFREMRLTGSGSSHVSNSAASSIVGRLTGLLSKLARERPTEGWGQYLTDGAPLWSRIAVTGFSQGAGQAAFLAKKVALARVVLFSGPEDYMKPSGRLAPWIATASATPVDRWHAVYNTRENGADRLKLAYETMRIPASQIHAFRLDLPNAQATYHGVNLTDQRYAGEWRTMFGKAN